MHRKERLVGDDQSNKVRDKINIIYDTIIKNSSRKNHTVPFVTYGIDVK
jgi:hypothetical protein